jgi:hypothetical protein
MILIDNGVVKLDYDPATDILHVNYPDLHGYLVPEINYNIDLIVDQVRSYDIKYLLLDARQTVVSIDAEASRKVAVYLASSLTKTRLKKVARVASPNPALEKRSESTIQTITTTIELPYQLNSFTEVEEAINWLKQKN